MEQAHDGETISEMLAYWLGCQLMADIYIRGARHETETTDRGLTERFFNPMTDYGDTGNSSETEDDDASMDGLSEQQLTDSATDDEADGTEGLFRKEEIDADIWIDIYTHY
jgi:hypothetical protein